jgi:hypothetical protein
MIKLEDKSLSESLCENEEYLKRTIGTSSDTEYRRLTVTGLDNCEALLVYIRKLVKAELVERFVVEPLKMINKLPPKKCISSNK